MKKLSQFFSGIYLKPLDDAFLTMDVTYIRYQDDIIIFCKSKRQLNRCKQRMMAVLKTPVRGFNLDKQSPAVVSRAI